MLSFLTLIGRTMYFHSGSRRTSQSKSQHVWNKNIIPWKARSFLSTYDVELRGRGAWGRFFFVACPADFSSFCDSFFLNQNKRGGEGGAGAGVPRAPDVELGGGGWGREFCRLACRLFFLLRFFFLNQNKRGGRGQAGVPRSSRRWAGGGGVGALFLSLALPAFLPFAILFLKPK